MDYLRPTEVVKAMLAAGDIKAGLSVRDLLIRGGLSGALLGVATSLALTATLQTNTPLVGALVFPVGFVMIVLLGLELVTGSFGNLVGGLLFTGLFLYWTYAPSRAAAARSTPSVVPETEPVRA